MGIKLIQAVTVSESLIFMKGQVKYLNSRAYDVKVMSSYGENIRRFEEREGTEVLVNEMEREISLAKDLQSLIRSIRIIRKEKPEVVNASTPKAGLLVMLASYICRVPIRIYTIRGLRVETTSGLKRGILLAAEKVAAASATHCLAVSESLKDRVVEFGISPVSKVTVLGKGSGDGFEITRFQKTANNQQEIDAKRMDFGLAAENLVLGFVGRMTKDKGIAELVSSFLTLHAKYPNLRLLLVGDYEEGDMVDAETRNEIRDNPNIIHTGFQSDPVPFYHLMDIFVFLTKREGFGNVSIEAALSGVPVVVSNVTGAKDTIVDGGNGFLVDCENREDIAEKLELLLLAPEMRARMGEFGQRWAAENFSNATIWNELDGFYQQCMAERLRPARQVL